MTEGSKISTEIISVGEMSGGKKSCRRNVWVVGEMFVDEMSVGEMSVVEMYGRRNFWQRNVCRRNFCWRNVLEPSYWPFRAASTICYFNICKQK